MLAALSAACHARARPSGVCAHDGRFPSVRADGACPPIGELSTIGQDVVSFHVIDSRMYEGPLPRCANRSPTEGGFRFRFRVDDVQVKSTETVVRGADLDAARPCGLGVAMWSSSETLALTPGRVVSLAQRTIIREHGDAPVLYALFDASGGILYATVFGARVDRLAADFGDWLPGLRVQLSSTRVCRAADIGEDLVTASLWTGPAACTLDSHTDRCCDLWGKAYEVQMLAAFGPRADRPRGLVGFTLRAPGFVVPAR